MSTDEMFRTLPSIINDKGELYALHIFKGSKRIIIQYRTDLDINGHRKYLANTRRSSEVSLEHALRSMLNWLIKFGYYNNHLVNQRNNTISELTNSGGYICEITKEELVADIRNKLNPISTLIGMVDDYMNGVKSDEEYDFINKSIKEQLPIVKDVMEYMKKII